jgi:hypothetical protein
MSPRLYWTGSGGYIRAAKIRAISKAVLAACDGQYGVKDGIVNEPTWCRFNSQRCCTRELKRTSVSMRRKLRRSGSWTRPSELRPAHKSFRVARKATADGNRGLPVLRQAIATEASMGGGFFRYMVFSDPPREL